MMLVFIAYSLPVLLLMCATLEILGFTLAVLEVKNLAGKLALVVSGVWVALLLVALAFDSFRAARTLYPL